MIDVILDTFLWVPKPLFPIVSAIFVFFFIFAAVSVILVAFQLIQFIVNVFAGVLSKVVELFV